MRICPFVPFVANPLVRVSIMFTQCHHVVDVESSVARIMSFDLRSGANAHARVVR